MLNIQKFDINEVIKNTAASFEGSCTTRNILLELILSGHELYAQADIEQIQQVLYNLLNNAIKFSPDNSTITIETTEKKRQNFRICKGSWYRHPKVQYSKDLGTFLQNRHFQRQRPERHRSGTCHCQRNHQCSWTEYQCDQYRGRWL